MRKANSLSPSLRNPLTYTSYYVPHKLSTTCLTSTIWESQRSSRYKLFISQAYTIKAANAPHEENL